MYDGGAEVPDELGTHEYDQPDMSYDSYDADMAVDTHDGSVDIGPATIDTDGDGHADTAVVHDVNGDTVLYTDSEHDGHADIATEFTPDGQVIVADDTGHGWVQTQHTTLEGTSEPVDGSFTPPVPATDDSVTAAADDAYWSGWAGAFSDTGSAQGVVRIDATTGQWISRN